MKRFIAMLLAVVTLVACIPMSVSAAEVNPETGMPFKDVKTGHWFYDAVKYTYDAGIFAANNQDGDLFAPNASMTRAMFVTVLFRLSGID
ncbi:MAG: S-layer homology domain-containing protein, partial [Clostridia bacterium]|nr:S-layer homology domain-containing protein [Clostridia bacterium]